MWRCTNEPIAHLKAVPSSLGTSVWALRKDQMNIFIFKSESNRELRAFSDDQGGHKLPKQFRPWHAVGVVKPDGTPPNNLSRDVIEKAIADSGYQLYKMKADK